MIRANGLRLPGVGADWLGLGWDQNSKCYPFPLTVFSNMPGFTIWLFPPLTGVIGLSRRSKM